MAYVSSDLPLRAETNLLRGASTALASLGGAIVTSLRQRWVYQRTLFELQGYSDHNLRDLGAGQGVEEFARRAAGL